MIIEKVMPIVRQKIFITENSLCLVRWRIAILKYFLNIFLYFYIMVSQKLSDLQLELLKVYSFQTNEEDLLAIKQMLAKYFSEKLINKIDTAITNNNISEQDINKWLDK